MRIGRGEREEEERSRHRSYGKRRKEEKFIRQLFLPLISRIGSKFFFFFSSSFFTSCRFDWQTAADRPRERAGWKESSSLSTSGTEKRRRGERPFSFVFPLHPAWKY